MYLNAIFLLPLSGGFSAVARYSEPIKTTEGKVNVKSIAYDPVSKKYSPIQEEKFDISRKLWKLVRIADKNAYSITDGNTETQWYQNRNMALPVDLVIDLGKTENVAGFKYLPDQHWWGSGIMTEYRFYVSSDNASWTPVQAGEFPNIKNNPTWQTITFAPVKARYIKPQALRNTQGDNSVGYSEIDIVTQSF
jgi:alpha-L-fucosidase